MDILIYISWFLMGSASAYYAKKRGRNPYVWFGLGLLFGLFGLIFLFILPKRVEEKPAVVVEKIPDLFSPRASNEPVMFWYYLDDENKQQGPMSPTAFECAQADGRVKSFHYVWNTQMENWKKLEEI
jgi:hypothetical protein